MEQETFWTLLHNAAHWQFELFLQFVFDIVLGIIIWPWFKSSVLHHESDDKKIEALEKQYEALAKQHLLVVEVMLVLEGGLIALAKQTGALTEEKNNEHLH